MPILLAVLVRPHPQRRIASGTPAQGNHSVLPSRCTAGSRRSTAKPRGGRAKVRVQAALCRSIASGCGARRTRRQAHAANDLRWEKNRRQSRAKTRGCRRSLWTNVAVGRFTACPGVGFYHGQGFVTRMSSMYSFPAPPAVGAARSPTPMYNVLTAVTFTPASLNLLSGIGQVSHFVER